MSSFRTEAKQLISEAKESLALVGNSHVRSAALSLRMAMEALAYERASIYNDDLPPDEYKTWQPRILLKRLVEIDPYAMTSSTVRYGKESTYGKKPKEMKFLGQENVLDMATVKKHYDAIGSYLHIPVLQKFEEGNPHDYVKLRAKCEAVAQAIDEALSSSLWNSSLRQTSSLDCMNCGEGMRRRFRPGSDDREVACFECDAKYTMSEEEDGRIHWTAHSIERPCPNKDCEDTIEIWEHEHVRGANWQCDTCKKRFILELGIMNLNDDPGDGVG